MKKKRLLDCFQIRSDAGAFRLLLGTLPNKQGESALRYQMNDFIMKMISDEKVRKLEKCRKAE